MPHLYPFRRPQVSVFEVSQWVVQWRLGATQFLSLPILASPGMNDYRWASSGEVGPKVKMDWIGGVFGGCGYVAVLLVRRHR